MNNYSSYDPADRWYKLLELFASNSSSKHQHLETYKQEEKNN